MGKDSKGQLKQSRLWQKCEKSVSRKRTRLSIVHAFIEVIESSLSLREIVCTSCNEVQAQLTYVSNFKSQMRCGNSLIKTAIWRCSTMAVPSADNRKMKVQFFPSLPFICVCSSVGRALDF